LFSFRGREVFNLSLPKNTIALSEMARAMSIGMPEKGIFNDYNKVLDLQNNVFNSIDILQGKTIITPNQIDKINSAFLSPISGAVVDIGLNATNINKLLNEGTIQSSDFVALQGLSNISLNVIKEQQNFLLSNLEKATNLKKFDVGSILSTPMVATGLDMVARALPTFPSDVNLSTLDAVRDRDFLTKPELNKEQERLDNILRKIDPTLTEIRKGCWKTFYQKGPDYIRQASCSMRGLVDTLLRIIAPHDEVVKTDYFEKSFRAKTEKGLPTRKAKIYYVVGYDKKRGKHLQRVVKAFDEAYQNLSGWDHEPIDNDVFVRGVFMIIEGSLLALLSEIRKGN